MPEPCLARWETHDRRIRTLDAPDIGHPPCHASSHPVPRLLYLVNHLDRTNMSFAGPGGMRDALDLTSTGFGFAAGIFFLGYLLLEVPATHNGNMTRQ